MRPFFKTAKKIGFFSSIHWYGFCSVLCVSSKALNTIVRKMLQEIRALGDQVTHTSRSVEDSSKCLQEFLRRTRQIQDMQTLYEERASDLDDTICRVKSLVDREG